MSQGVLRFNVQQSADEARVWVVGVFETKTKDHWLLKARVPLSKQEDATAYIDALGRMIHDPYGDGGTYRGVAAGFDGNMDESGVRKSLGIETPQEKRAIRQQAAVVPQEETRLRRPFN